MKIEDFHKNLLGEERVFVAGIILEYPVSRV
jgi:hypothetical protein